ncbi:tRNA 2'-phosphotransferase [Gnomoniopsis smithogilvyi]|uniref:2'-phosphotransferase n=1 Tax=Gnomoniopsis smithogilvyi TaxID=1191159 RepID=A0A9W9CWX5_9PEZI|nr:tRNA 2'-phosphotransferase [Gnomoniopsis smithogilvyi]
MDDGTDELAARFEEQASMQQQQSPLPKAAKKNKGAGGGGGAGAGAGAGGAQKREKDISRALSRLLRHQATNAGIQLDREGYAPLDKVLQYGPVRSLKATVSDIIAVTADNEKQRFSMKPADANSALAETEASYWLIRANQGHSIAIESEALLTPITVDAGNVPPVVVHGTYFAFWERIVASGGLSKMGRNHVHCSTGLPEDAAGVVSGMRGDAELLVYVDVRKSLEEGAMSWWMSENGVVLTEGIGEEGLVPVKYFKEVVGRKEDVGVLWKDGEKVADLPEGVKGRAPPGKGVHGEGVAGVVEDKDAEGEVLEGDKAMLRSNCSTIQRIREIEILMSMSTDGFSMVVTNDTPEFAPKRSLLIITIQPLMDTKTNNPTPTK